jgi:hypothetical protein
MRSVTYNRNCSEVRFAIVVSRLHSLDSIIAQ